MGTFILIIGYIDGKDICIQFSKQTRCMYIYYKKGFSIVLQTVAGYCCLLVFGDVVVHGKQRCLSCLNLSHETLLKKLLSHEDRVFIKS